MIFAEPALSKEDHKVLEILEGQRRRLRIATQNNPRRWHGTLRKSTLARAIQGSNAIEGYNASMDEAMAAVEDEPPLDEKTETWLAIGGYRAAMTYIMQAAEDSYFEFSRQFLKSLHFMMTGFDLSSRPGQWRPGAVRVVNNEPAQSSMQHRTSKRSTLWQASWWNIWKGQVMSPLSLLRQWRI